MTLETPSFTPGLCHQRCTTLYANIARAITLPTTYMRTKHDVSSEKPKAFNATNELQSYQLFELVGLKENTGYKFLPK